MTGTGTHNQPMRDDRGVVLNWLVKLLIGLAVGGVILFDAGSIAVNFFGLDSAADEVANSFATQIASGDVSETEARSLGACGARKAATPLCQELKDKAKEYNARILEVTLDLKGEVKVRLRRTADTLIVKRIGPIEDWGTATAEGRASTDTQ